LNLPVVTEVTPNEFSVKVSATGLTVNRLNETVAGEFAKIRPGDFIVGNPSGIDFVAPTAYTVTGIIATGKNVIHCSQAIPVGAKIGYEVTQATAFGPAVKRSIVFIDTTDRLIYLDDNAVADIAVGSTVFNIAAPHPEVLTVSPGNPNITPAILGFLTFSTTVNTLVATAGVYPDLLVKPRTTRSTIIGLKLDTRPTVTSTVQASVTAAIANGSKAHLNPAALDNRDNLDISSVLNANLNVVDFKFAV
jgi:hypothetical protein